MVGRRYTWHKPNGTVKSRIDRILVSSKWLESWPNTKQYVLGMSVSNHCALILKVLDKDWRRKPFRSLDVWQKDNSFIVFVREKWSNYKIQGHGLFVRKEKLKKLKVVIKVWNREVF